MISVKGGTQTWSTAAQKVDYKTDGAQKISAADKSKFFDGEELGDTLNKVADPNYVEPSKKMRTVGNAELGKDAFMTLLLTQMKNQDPTNPLKSHEMAAQLAQFTSLEKLNNINEGIGNLRKDQQPDHNFQALSMIGKVATMDNSKIARTDANDSHELRFTLAGDAPKANVEVRDMEGNVVRKMEMKNLKAGVNTMNWNGKNDDGVTAPVGDYTLAVEAFGSNGKKLYAQTKAEGVITGVNFTSHGAQLMMGKQAINMSDVKSISDPSVMPPAQQLTTQNMMAAPGGHMIPMPTQMPAQQVPAQAPAQGEGEAAAPAGHASPMMPIGPAMSAPVQGPRKAEVKPETKANSAKRATLSKGSLNESSMTSGLINTLTKEGAKAGMG